MPRSVGWPILDAIDFRLASKDTADHSPATLPDSDNLPSYVMCRWTFLRLVLFTYIISLSQHRPFLSLSLFPLSFLSQQIDPEIAPGK